MNLEKISSARLNVLSTAASAFMPSLINGAGGSPKLPSPCLAWRREARGAAMQVRGVCRAKPKTLNCTAPVSMRR